MLNVVLLWIWSCAYLNCAGWLLSALHQLNATGYTVVLLSWFAALAIWRKRTSEEFLPKVHWPKFRRRFGRPFPLAFLLLAAMALLGGALHPPSNYDALAYRIPRVLHWLVAEKWHWIYTLFPRVNTRACGIEWVSAPLIALLKTDRLLFFVNIVCFLLLPGLVFSTFTRLGVRRRVAWHWMWIVPTGYCFLLQAGGIGNDLFGAVFALAAMDFALRAKTSGSPRYFFTSVLAAALLTSNKASNLPLLLPWAIAILPSLKQIGRWPIRAAAVGMTALLASFLPTALLNAQYCGDWSGLAPEGIGAHKRPVLLAGAESALIVTKNLTPPVFPFTKQWHEMVESVMPEKLGKELDKIMEKGSAVATFDVYELQNEDNAGLGFSVSILLITSTVAAMLQNRQRSTKRTASFWQTSIQVAPFISLLALISNSNVEPARVIAPYYPLLLVIFLSHPGQSSLLKRFWWRSLAFAIFGAAAISLTLSPSRPLFPVGTFLQKIHAVAAEHPALKRIEQVYSVYHARWDAFAPARDQLPPNLNVLGLVTWDDPETSLWRPFGTLRVEHVLPGDTPADLKARNVEYVLIKTDGFEARFACSIDDWVKRMNAEIIRVIPLNLRASVGSRDWYLVRLRYNSRV